MVDEGEVGHGLSARKARTGTDVCLIGVGKMFGACLEAAELLAAEGIEATVWDPRVVKPLDPRPARRRRRVRPWSSPSRTACARAASAPPSPRRSSAAPSAPAARPACRSTASPSSYIPHGKPDAILAELGLDAAGIAATTRRLLA